MAAELPEVTQSPYVVAQNPPQAFRIAPGHSKAYIEDLIRSKARLAGLDEDLLVKLAWCESGLQQKWNYLHDTNPDYYTAFGVFQIIKGHEAKYGIERMSLEGNIDLAIQIYLKEGVRPWNLSFGCWQ